MAIFVRPPPKFYLKKVLARKFDAKSRDFKMAVKYLIFYEKSWGKLLRVTNEK